MLVTTGLTALYAAVGGGHIEIVRELIAAKAQCHTVDADGLTPLHEAANNGDFKMAKLLLVHGARVAHAAHSSGATVRGHVSMCLCILLVGEMRQHDTVQICVVHAAIAHGSCWRRRLEHSGGLVPGLGCTTRRYST